MVDEVGGLVRFEVRSYTRASSLIDRIGMETIGEPLRRATWTSLVENVVRRSGGEAVDGVRTETAELAPEDAEGLERWAEELVVRRRREAALRGEG